MSLKAVLWDFNGIIINDERIHAELIADLLLTENIRPQLAEYQQCCLGRSDRACISLLLERRGRIVAEDYLLSLIQRKSQAYREKLNTLDKLPIYPGVEDLIYKIRVAQLKMGVVSGAGRAEIELVLSKMGISAYMGVIVAGDDIKASKPDPDGYLIAAQQLNQLYPELEIQPQNCIAIEDTPAGMKAAKQAGMQVIGVANTYPFHMVQRQANWTVDSLLDIELDRIRQLYTQKQPTTQG